MTLLGPQAEFLAIKALTPLFKLAMATRSGAVLWPTDTASVQLVTAVAIRAALSVAPRMTRTAKTTL